MSHHERAVAWWRTRRTDRDGARADAIFAGALDAGDRDAAVQWSIAVLRTEAAAVAAPVPTPGLARRLAFGDPSVARERPVPALFVPPRTAPSVVTARVRYSIAAAVAALAVSCSLTAAGALPAGLQGPIAHALGHVGIEVPGDGSDHPSPPHPGGEPHGAGSGGAPAVTGPGGDLEGGATGGSRTTTNAGGAPPAPLLGGTPASPTLPPVDVPGGPAVSAPPAPPDVTAPEVTLPPVLPTTPGS